MPIISHRPQIYNEQTIFHFASKLKTKIKALRIEKEKKNKINIKIKNEK